MGTKRHHKLSTALVAAIALCLQAQVAQAQACLAPDDVTDAGIYAIPVVADGFRASCAPHLAAGRFLRDAGRGLCRSLQRHAERTLAGHAARLHGIGRRRQGR